MDFWKMLYVLTTAHFSHNSTLCMQFTIGLLEDHVHLITSPGIRGRGWNGHHGLSCMCCCSVNYILSASWLPLLVTGTLTLLTILTLLTLVFCGGFFFVADPLQSYGLVWEWSVCNKVSIRTGKGEKAWALMTPTTHKYICKTYRNIREVCTSQNFVNCDILL